MAACAGRTPTAPTPPPVVTKATPVIQSVTVSSDRAEAGQPLTVKAAVTDADTSVDQLTYQWSASPANGTFTGTGATVTWTPPAGQRTPDLYTIKVTVGVPDSPGTSSPSPVSATTTVHYNDSPAETVALASQFLKDFGTFSVTPEECVRNFSDSCAGKQAELSDVTFDRDHYHILSSTFTADTVTFNSDKTSGEVDGPCVFEDTPDAGEPYAGVKERWSGTCHLTTVYENYQWFLCVSNFWNGVRTPESLMAPVSGYVASHFRVP